MRLAFLKSFWQSLVCLQKLSDGLTYAAAVMAIIAAVTSSLGCTSPLLSVTAAVLVASSVVFRIREKNLRSDMNSVVLDTLAARTSARHLTEEQKAKFLSLLKDAPTGSIRVRYAEQDGEARVFADQIVAVLEKAHWYVEGHEPIGQYRGHPHLTEDLVFDVPANTPPPASLQPLRDALAKIGFSSGTRDLGSADSVVDLFVGTKRARD